MDGSLATCGSRPTARAARMRHVLHEVDQLLRRLDLVPVGLERDLAAIEHHEAVGDLEDVVDVVADEEDRVAARPAPGGRSGTPWPSR